jgi:hypothetical protein
MSYIGNTSTTQAFTPAIDYFSGNASTTAFTLSKPVASVAQVQVVVNNVAQNPSSAYTVSSNTITFTSAPSSGTNNIYVYYTSPITQVIQPGQNTVYPSSLSTTNALYWDTSGNVGIGNTSPSYKLDITGQGRATTGFAVSTDGSTFTPSGLNAIPNYGVGYITSASQTTLSGFAGIPFYTNQVERMRIDSSGNVGIGTTSPGYKLQVAGSIAASTQILGPNGSAATPSISSTGETNAGLFFGDNGVASFMAMSTAGTERMRIDPSGNLLFNSGYGSVATAYGCRAWVNFNGTGTIAIRASGNVSSITDGGVGIYRVNFSASMPDVNFSTNASVAGGGTVNSSTCAFLVNATSAAAAGQTSNVAYVDVWCYHPGNQTAQDNAWCSVSVFR